MCLMEATAIPAESMARGRSLVRATTERAPVKHPAWIVGAAVGDWGSERTRNGDEPATGIYTICLCNGPAECPPRC